MTIRENVPLSELTTFKAGGMARFVAPCESASDIEEALLLAKEKDLPWYVLGQGSNMVPADEGFAGVILLMRNQSVLFEVKSEEVTLVVCGAGVLFDTVVDAASERKLWGLENLAGIPGTMGAAPIQNIGAYGAEIAKTFSYVDVFDTEKNEQYRMYKDDCDFSYRESIFKCSPHLLILRVALTLSSIGTPDLSYADLAALKEKGVVLETPNEVASAVRSIRSNKFPDWHVYGTAGSFFKNPIISEAKYDELCARYGAIPKYEAEGGVKIPLAFILDKVLGLRGYRKGKAWLFERQPLVLVAQPGATAKEITDLADEVAQKVFEATGIEIEREPRSLKESF